MNFSIKMDLPELFSTCVTSSDGTAKVALGSHYLPQDAHMKHDFQSCALQWIESIRYKPWTLPRMRRSSPPASTLGLGVMLNSII